MRGLVFMTSEWNIEGWEFESSQGHKFSKKK